MEEFWAQQRVSGWGAFILKEKLKLLKAALRRWNSNVFGDVNASRKRIILKLNELDVKAEIEGLNN